MRRTPAPLAILGALAFLSTSAILAAASGSSAAGQRRLEIYHHGSPVVARRAAAAHCYNQISGQTDSGFYAASQVVPDYGVTMMAADNFRCYGSALIALKRVSVLGWYWNCPTSGCLPPDSFNVTVWPNDPDDTQNEPGDRDLPPICKVSTTAYTVVPPGSGAAEHKFFITLAKPYCKFPSHKWVWLEVQAVMDFDTHGQWGWSLDKGPAIKFDADWKNPDGTLVPECQMYDDNGFDLEGCLFGAENGTPDLLFTVN